MNIVLTELGNGQSLTTLAGAINSNSAAIEDAFVNVLDRTHSDPMSSSLDMNSFQILNLPEPSTLNSPARLVDVNTATENLVGPQGPAGIQGPTGSTGPQGIGSVTAVSNPSTTNATGPGIMGISGVPQGGGDNASNLYTGNTITSTGFGKFVTGIDSGGNLLTRSLTTLSQSSDGRSLPGFPVTASNTGGGDIPPFMLLPYYALIAANSPVGLPTLCFGNMVAPNNEKWWFQTHLNNGDFAIGTTPDAWVGVGGAQAAPPIYAFTMLRNGLVPTNCSFATPLSVSTIFPWGTFTSNGTVPVNNSTLVIGGTTVTFVTGTPSGNQVKIGASFGITITNLLTFLNASVDVNLSQCTYYSDGNIIVYAFFKTLGTSGNSFTIVAGTSPASNFTTSGATLSGGGGNALSITGNVALTGTSSLTVGGTLSINGSIVTSSVFTQPVTVGAVSALTNAEINIVAPDLSVRNALSIRHASADTYGWDWRVDLASGLLRLDCVNANSFTNSFIINRTTGSVQFANTLKTAASSTSVAGLNIPTGVAPTSPNDGDMWNDGTNIKIRVGSTTKTFTLT